MRRISVFLAMAMLTVLFGCSGSSSSSSDGGDEAVNITPSVPNYSTATQEVLPVMQESGGSASMAPTKASYAPSAYWNDTVIFSGMAQKALSLDPSVGVESVFFLVAQIQNIISMIGDAGGFNIVDSECQLPTIDGIAGTAVAVGSEDSLSVPFFGTSPYSNYDCLITVTALPGSTVGSMSYAFGMDDDSSGNSYVRYLVMSNTRTQPDSTAEREVFIVDYDQSVNNLRVDYALYADNATPIGFRIFYDGDPEAHTFTFKSLLRGPLSQCSPAATDADDEAKKLAAKGISQGESSRYAMRLQRVCDQQSVGYPTTPQDFCIDGVTKTPLSDGSSCDTYADALDGEAMYEAADAPFANDAFGNDNLITLQTRRWITVGDDYVSSGATESSAFWIDEDTDYYITSGSSTVVVPNTDVIYAAYVGGNDKVNVVRYVPTDAAGNFAWEYLGEFSDGAGSNVDITVMPQAFVTDDGELNGVPYVVYHRVTPGVPGVLVKKYVNGAWADATTDPPMTGNYVRNVRIVQSQGQIIVSWAIASAYGYIYASWLPHGADSWVLVTGESVGTCTSYTYDMDAIVPVTWSDPSYDMLIMVVRYVEGEGVHLHEANCLSTARTCDGAWGEHTTFDLIPATTSKVQSLSMDVPDSPWGWFIAYTLEAEGSDRWMNVALVENGLWRAVSTTGLVNHNVEDVKVSYQGGVTAIAYTDIDNDVYRGRLAVQNYSVSSHEWSEVGNKAIEVYGTHVDDFHVFSGTPYILYNVPSVNRLQLVKFGVE